MNHLGQQTHCPQCQKALLQTKETLAFCHNCRFPLKLIAGKYKMQCQLNEGGFGTIYLANHVRLLRDTERVIKIIKPELFKTHPSMAERFEREVQMTAMLSQINDHIVRVYDDFGEDPDLGHYYVMEYLQGQTLTELIEKGDVLEDSSIFRIFRGLCLALNTAHSEGVVHRDLKPDNVFLIQRDVNPHFVKLLDFGIARPTEGTDNKITQGALGSPMYMAPEQCLNQEITTATDVYAAGLLLFELFTGKNAYGFDNLEAQKNPALFVLSAHIGQEARSLAEFRPDLPGGFARVLSRMLAKQPKDRYQTMVQVWEELRVHAPEHLHLQPLVTDNHELVSASPPALPKAFVTQTSLYADTPKNSTAEESLPTGYESLKEDELRQALTDSSPTFVAAMNLPGSARTENFMPFPVSAPTAVPRELVETSKEAGKSGAEDAGFEMHLERSRPQMHLSELNSPSGLREEESSTKRLGFGIGVGLFLLMGLVGCVVGFVFQGSSGNPEQDAAKEIPSKQARSLMESKRAIVGPKAHAVAPSKNPKDTGKTLVKREKPVSSKRVVIAPTQRWEGQQRKAGASPQVVYVPPRRRKVIRRKLPVTRKKSKPEIRKKGKPRLTWTSRLCGEPKPGTRWVVMTVVSGPKASELRRLRIRCSSCQSVGVRRGRRYCLGVFSSRTKTSIKLVMNGYVPCSDLLRKQTRVVWKPKVFDPSSFNPSVRCFR